MAEPLHMSFVDEATAHLAQVQTLLCGLDRGVEITENDDVNRCYRAMHTISGLAGFLALKRIQVLAQTAERLLEEMRLNRLSRGAARLAAVRRASQRCGKRCGASRIWYGVWPTTANPSRAMTLI